MLGIVNAHGAKVLTEHREEGTNDPSSQRILPTDDVRCPCSSLQGSCGTTSTAGAPGIPGATEQHAKGLTQNVSLGHCSGFVLVWGWESEGR